MIIKMALSGPIVKSGLRAEYLISADSVIFWRHGSLEPVQLFRLP